MRTEQAERNHTEIPAASRSGADSTPGARSALCESMNAHPWSGDACGTPTGAAYQPRGFERTSVTSRVPNHPEDSTFKTSGAPNELSRRLGQGRSCPVGEQEGFGSLTRQGGRANTGDGGSKTVPVPGRPVPPEEPGQALAEESSSSAPPSAGGPWLSPRARYRFASGD